MRRRKKKKKITIGHRFLYAAGGFFSGGIVTLLITAGFLSCFRGARYSSSGSEMEYVLLISISIVPIGTLFFTIYGFFAGEKMLKLLEKAWSHFYEKDGF